MYANLSSLALLDRFFIFGRSSIILTNLQFFVAGQWPIITRQKLAIKWYMSFTKHLPRPNIKEKSSLATPDYNLGLP